MAWLAAAPLEQLVEGEVRGVVLAEVPVALYRIDGEVFATHDICTHAHACLSDGYLEDGRIECPLHQALFDVRTGKAISGPANGDLRVYPVQLRDGQVFVDLDTLP